MSEQTNNSKTQTKRCYVVQGFYSASNAWGDIRHYDVNSDRTEQEAKQEAFDFFNFGLYNHSEFRVITRDEIETVVEQ